VKRGLAERLDALGRRYRISAAGVDQLARLLYALAAEPDPPTTVRAPEAAVDQHVADSLSALDFEQLRSASRVADIGSGAGFPGLPLAVALPDARVDLVESVGKKCAVIERLAAAAQIRNARVLQLRAEELAAGEGRGAYDVVAARAVGALPVLVEYAAPLLRERGWFIAWKGAREPGEEAAGAAAARVLGLELAEVRRVVPYEGTRDLNLYLYSKDRSTPNEFPRRPGLAAKRPLS
jgi:16S rRNA (guanine527-N7)-methyltransferase